MMKVDRLNALKPPETSYFRSLDPHQQPQPSFGCLGRLRVHLSRCSAARRFPKTVPLRPERRPGPEDFQRRHFQSFLYGRIYQNHWMQSMMSMLMFQSVLTTIKPIRHVSSGQARLRPTSDLFEQGVYRALKTWELACFLELSKIRTR